MWHVVLSKLISEYIIVLLTFGQFAASIA